jgi:DNA-directed RNA polymerase specialized sigma24 family protein
MSMTTVALAPAGAPNVSDPLDPGRLVAARKLMVTSLVNRGFPPADAEDAAHDVLRGILERRSGRITDKLADLDSNAGYFVRAALNAYLMQMRSETRRRRRQQRQWLTTDGDSDDAGRDGPTGADVLALAEGAPLTGRQRKYLSYVFVERLSIEEIAARTDTTPRAVRALLQRAGEILHRRRMHLAA